MKRAPVWFTHGKSKERISRWWPWVLGAGLGGMYWYAPEPFEQVRVGTLYAIRRPVLQTTQWLEVRDVDPESMALDLPPDQIFGPLPLKKQIQFIVHALNEDNELADGYITRLVIDHMDLSLDPPFLGDALVEAGAAEILRFAVKDFLDIRPNAKHKFFDADRFLRFTNVIASTHELAKELVEEHDGVNLVFKALSQANNEYARVLGMRAMTLFAFQQDKDGEIERKIIEGGFLPKMVNFYRQSTGDATDTRFVTLLFSSLLRLYPKETYQVVIESNLVKASVNNLNIARYKGLPQHIRLLHDLERARAIVHGEGGNGSTTGGAAESGNSGKKGGLFGWFGDSNKKTTPAAKTPNTVTAADAAGTAATSANESTDESLRDMKHVQAQPGAMRRRKMGVQEGQQWESKYHEPHDLPPMPPPRDPDAPLNELLAESDFIPVALGVCDLFPEYFESTRELVHMMRGVAKEYLTPFDLFEYRFLAVATKLFNRHGLDADFEAHGMAEDLVDLCKWILNDRECRPYMDPKCSATNNEIKLSIQSVRDHIAAREKRLAEGLELRTRSIPVPV
jgi:hypothetical protein